jgi:hypothetical protein
MKIEFEPIKNTDAIGESWDNIFGMVMFLVELNYSKTDIISMINSYYNVNKTNELLNKAFYRYEKKYNTVIRKPILYKETRIPDSETYDKIWHDFEKYCDGYNNISKEVDEYEKEFAKDESDLPPISTFKTDFDKSWDDMVDSIKPKDTTKEPETVDEMVQVLKKEFQSYKKEEIDYKELYQKLLFENETLKSIIKNFAVLL